MNDGTGSERPADGGTPHFSLIIPAYNEERLLPRLLDTVAVARRAYPGGTDAIEVIVADNGSTDATAEIARRWGAVVVPVAKRCIAAARNGGAAQARGMILCFLDADSRMHPRSFEAIEQALAGGRYVAGASGVRLERWSFGIVVTFALFVPLLWLTGMDTGLVFCRRQDFLAVGGYNEVRLFAEDVQFLWDLKRLGKTRRQRLLRLTSIKAVASTRKFDTYGEWHYLTQMLRLAVLMVRQPAAITAFARRYWYEDR